MLQSKHVIRFSFLALFCIIFANVILYRYFLIEEIVLNQFFQKNIHIAKMYKKQILNFNKEGTLNQNLQGNKNIIEKSKNFFASFRSGIAIYDKSKNLVFKNNNESNDKIEYYNSNYSYSKVLVYLDRIFLRKYVNYNHTSQIDEYEKHYFIPRAIIHEKEGSVSEKSLVVSCIPIFIEDVDGNHIEAFIRITTDVTKHWENINYIDKRTTLIVVILFMMFFGIIMYNTNSAQIIINKHLEQNKILEEAKNKAEKENSTKMDFLANVSHELRTPLNAIIGFSEIIIAETYGRIENKEYREYVFDINNSGKHLLDIINDILDFSKASVNQLEIQSVELDLNKLSASSLRFVKPKAYKASVNLDASFLPGRVVVKADPKRLKQAVLNLLTNAIKFTPKKGFVELKITKNESKKLAYIKVSDTGIGMKQEDIPVALSSFGQIDNSISRKYDGTGLGLPLTKKLVELMGGVLTIKSKYGHGTTATIAMKYIEELKFNKD